MPAPSPRAPSVRTALVAALTVGCAGGLATVALAQRGAPVLHQDLPPPTGERSADALPRSVFGAEPGEFQNPDAFRGAGKILPEPRVEQPKSDEEPVHGRGGFGTDRDTETRPDTQTGPDSRLQYVSVFNPSVLPFKRMSAMNEVAGDYQLRTSRGGQRDLSIGGERSADRDLFWGSLMIDLGKDEEVPIPSVAPDMRILSYEIEPTTRISFSLDSADNFWVRSDEPGATGTYRLVFLADAAASYFAPTVPKRYRVRDVKERAGALYRPLPAEIQPIADRALRALGVSRYSRLDIALDKLVYHFRGFEAGPIREPSGDIFWDLFTSQAGVCRHRSFAFMVAATGLGLPTRYVTNEAHAFVEVWAPEVEWMRIDLGGAALEMDVDNASDKSIYQPRDEDKFAQPENYQNNYTQLRGDIKGLSADQIAEGRTVQSPEGDAFFDPDAPPDPDEENPDLRVGPGRKLPEVPPEELVGKAPVRIGVTGADSIGFRGEKLQVSGQLASGGAGLPGQRVDLFLAPAGSGGDDAVPIGNTRTAADGSFSVEVDLPAELELGRYEVFAASPGNDKYSPAVSE